MVVYIVLEVDLSTDLHTYQICVLAPSSSVFWSFQLYRDGFFGCFLLGSPSDIEDLASTLCASVFVLSSSFSAFSLVCVNILPRVWPHDQRVIGGVSNG